MSDIDEVIHKLFSSRWSGALSQGSISEMRKELHKNLRNQIDGFWSGSTAYGIMTDGGFLVDSKRVRISDTNMAEGKKLTELGVKFMKIMSDEGVK